MRCSKCAINQMVSTLKGMALVDLLDSNVCSGTTVPNFVLFQDASLNVGNFVPA